MENEEIKQILSIFLTKIEKLNKRNLKEKNIFEKILKHLKELILQEQKRSKFLDENYFYFQGLFKQENKELDYLLIDFFKQLQKKGFLILKNSFEQKSFLQKPALEENLIFEKIEIFDFAFQTKTKKEKFSGDFFVVEICRILDHNDFSKNKEIIGLITKFIVMDENLINTLSLNKIIGSLFIYYFKGSEIKNDEKFSLYTNACLELIIRDLFTRIELFGDPRNSDFSQDKKDSNIISSEKNRENFIQIILNCNTFRDNMKIHQLINSLSTKSPFICRSLKNTPLRATCSPLLKTNLRIQEDEEKDKLFQYTKLLILQNFEKKTREIEKGVCIICQKQSFYYCTKTRHDLCSIECKYILSTITCSQKKIQKDKKLKYIEKGFIIMRYLFKLSSSKNEHTNLAFRKYVLRIMWEMFQITNEVFFANEKVMSTIKVYLKELVMNLVEDFEIAFLSLQILGLLFQKSKGKLGDDIFIFFQSFLVEIIKNEKIDKKIVFLSFEIIGSFFADVDTIANLFFNFDLNFETFSYVEDICNFFMKILQHKLGKNLIFELEQKSIVLDIIKNILKNFYLEFSQKEKKETNVDFVEKINNILLQKKTIERFIMKFNSDHKVLKFIEELNKINPEMSVEEKIAKIFFYQKNVSKKQMGQYFGEEAEFYQKTLKTFIGLENFKNESIDFSMRRFFQKFDLFGEGQKIDRILQTFAYKYADDNSDKISQQCAYGLSFLLIMLQSEIHNPKVPEKMALEQFLKLGKNIPDSDTFLNEKELRRLYKSVFTFSLSDFKDFFFNDFSHNDFFVFFLNKFENLKNTKDKCSYKIIEPHFSVYLCEIIFDSILSSNIIIAISIFFESADKENFIEKIFEIFEILLKIFALNKKEEQLEQILMSIMRLTSLDNLGRKLQDKNLMMLKLLIKFLTDNFFLLNKNCIIFSCKILTNFNFYINEENSLNLTYKTNCLLLKSLNFEKEIENIFFSLVEKFGDKNENYFNLLNQLFDIAGINLLNYKLGNSKTFLLKKLIQHGISVFTFDFEKVKNVQKDDNLTSGFEKKISIEVKERMIFELMINNLIKMIKSIDDIKIKDFASKTENSDSLIETSIFLLSSLRDIIQSFNSKKPEDFQLYLPFERLFEILSGDELTYALSIFNDIIQNQQIKKSENDWFYIFSLVSLIFSKSKKVQKIENNSKNTKIALTIIRYFFEKNNLFDIRIHLYVLKIFNISLEINFKNLDFILLIIKQIVIILIEKIENSQQLTEFIFPLLQILSSFRITASKNFANYIEAHRNLGLCLKKLAKSKFINNEHKEIIFKSVFLPIFEDLKICLNTSKYRQRFNYYREICENILELVFEFGIENHYFKISRVIADSFKVEHFYNNKSYLNELPAIQIFIFFKSEKNCKQSFDFIFSKIEEILNESQNFCKELKPFSFELMENLSNEDLNILNQNETKEFFDLLSKLLKTFKIEQIDFFNLQKDLISFLENIKKNIYIDDLFYNNSLLIILRLLENLIENRFNFLEGQQILIVRLFLKTIIARLNKNLEEIKKKKT